MTPSILTAAQEGLRLAEKRRSATTAYDRLAAYGVIHAHADEHYADICRWALELAERLAAIERVEDAESQVALWMTQ